MRRNRFKEEPVTCRPKLFFELFLPRAVLRGVKQLDSKNSSTLSVCIHGCSSCFASCFELFRPSCFVCPLPIGGTLRNTFENTSEEVV
jgi:hypothetical protein